MVERKLGESKDEERTMNILTGLNEVRVFLREYDREHPDWVYPARWVSALDTAESAIEICDQAHLLIDTGRQDMDMCERND